MIITLTHRGLEPKKKDFFTESSFEAFEDQAKRGFGLEFDVNFSKDNKVVIFHDQGLERITNGKDNRLFSGMTLDEIKRVKFKKGRVCSLNEVLLIIKYGSSKMNALHLKGKYQDEKYLEILLKYFKKFQQIMNKIIIFDVKVETAKYLLERMPDLILAPSVSHKYDIKRYNTCVNNTLLTIEEVISNKKLFQWVWLDEWDRHDEGGQKKTFYNERVFSLLKKEGFNIALVTPELHGTSPGLLGGETHQDAKNLNTIRKRIEKILKLNPNMVCTDYPELILECLLLVK
ncbi:MAG: hypothetical protein L3J07_00625 [Candidatus Magasanikbacteria bacterium]|nr:hypothetical protein [Candidatus Magasanikbacteria bacterium]